MADEIDIEGVKYISSKRAAELSGYAQDYIGQLARGGYIKAQRIGGLWHVSLDSLQEYGKSAEAYKPKTPERIQMSDPDSLISFDGKDYVSAARAAKLTGYHQDYVGQLARKGSVVSRQVGNRWYVEREGILAHKNEKDRLLGAVQAQSVGLVRPTADVIPSKKSEDSLKEADYLSEAYTYTADVSDLTPMAKDDLSEREYVANRESGAVEDEQHPVPIRIESTHVRPVAYQYEEEEILDHSERVKYVKSEVRRPRKTIFYGTMGAAALTVAIVLYFGFSIVSSNSTYAISGSREEGTGHQGLFSASASNAFLLVGDMVARIFVPELVYKRSKDF
jgi:hypothetical protein